MNNFGIMHKETKKFFCGFDAAGAVIWGEKKSARRESLQLAGTQARLFICNKINVQAKPVALAEWLEASRAD